jgi:predicted RecA/RadA family phage recombinase
VAGNIRFDQGDQLLLTVPSGVDSGEPVVYGNQPGVALTDRGEQVAGKATVKFNGVAQFELAGAAEEDPVYINVSTRALALADDAGSVFYGICVSDADDDDLVDVRIGGIPPGAGS